MKRINTVLLELTVCILDFLYRERHFQRFWVLEVIARAPYFAFLSVLHFRESLGLRTPSHFLLMAEHFRQTVNETEHLQEMERRGGDRYWIDRFLAYHLVLVYYWCNVGYYLIAPKSAYHLAAEVEKHATHTYEFYLLTVDRDDNRVREIMEDEHTHHSELLKAMEMI